MYCWADVGLRPYVPLYHDVLSFVCTATLRPSHHSTCTRAVTGAVSLSTLWLQALSSSLLPVGVVVRKRMAIFQCFVCECLDGALHATSEKVFTKICMPPRRRNSSGALPLSEYCSRKACGHPQVACQRRSTSTDPVGCLLCFGSLSLHYVLAVAILLVAV